MSLSTGEYKGYPLEDQRKSSVEEQFDRISGRYLSERSSPENIREKQRIFELVRREARFASVLDIGCGPGTITEDLLTISDHVWGIDISKDMIKTAVARFKDTQWRNRVEFSVGDAENLQFPNEYFDAVFSVGVLRYLRSWETGLREMYRVMKPDGVAVMTFFYRFSPHWFSSCFLRRPLLPLISLFMKRSLKGAFTLLKAEPLPFSYNKFRKVFAQTGFRDPEIRHSGFTVFPFDRLFPRLSTCVYLRAESAFFDSHKLGWLGSICIVKGVKR